MEKLVTKYRNWSELKQNLFLLLVITLVGALISVIFIFFDNVGVLLGWLLGSLVNLFAYFTIHKGSAFILGSADHPGRAAWSVLWSFLRLIFYAGALVIAGFASFRWGSLAHGYCNFISTALALTPTWIVLAISLIFRNSRAHKEAKEQGKDHE